MRLKIKKAMNLETFITKKETKNTTIDMDLVLNSIPPIKKEFSPDEEVQKLWSVPKKERKNAIKSFKEKLAHQREAWAVCRNNIERQIESDPDLPREEMISTINKFASHYGFAKNHIRVAESLVDDYIGIHNRVKKIRDEFSDDIALVNRLTGENFSASDAEDFEIKMGPISIEIACSEPNTKRIFENNSENSATKFSSGGFAAASDEKDPIYYIVENKDPLHDHDRERILPHEIEHQKNRMMAPKLFSGKDVSERAKQLLNKGFTGLLTHQLLENILRIERNFSRELLWRYEITKDLKQKKFYLKEFMNLNRESAFNSAKDEIIACFYDGVLLDGNNVENIFLEQDCSSYDYLCEVREYTKK